MLRAVYGTSPSAVWVAGDTTGSTQQWDGSRWSVVAPEVPYGVRSMSSDGTGRWAVGRYGAIYHWR